MASSERRSANSVGGELPDGILAFVKRDCPTCCLVEPVLAELAAKGVALTVYSQDDPAFPKDVPVVVDDRELERSYRMGIESVPTLVRIAAGKEVERLEGWQRGEWEVFTSVPGLGAGLPEYRPGCGSRSVEPAVAEELARRFGASRLRSRRVEFGVQEDAFEAMQERGWSDGLPLVPPTELRVTRMLEGTTRAPDEVIGAIPPDLVECTVEKVAVNAVMAGCKPEYLPVVLTALEAALDDPFCMHGLLATTWFAGPVVIVSGPVARAIGMNAGGNALGQGNRANATIGRALQLVIRNVGGGRPGGVDRATLGQPGKYTFCFAEDDEGSPWESLSAERGFGPGSSTVTLFAGDGVHGMIDQKARDPVSLCRSFAACLRSLGHPKLVQFSDAVLVVTPEHARVFRDAGWSKARVRQQLEELLRIPAAELVEGVGGIAEGIPEALAEKGELPKIRPGGLFIVHAGGKAGLFSAIIGGWASGPIGSSPVTREVRS